jgi:hypothetical protein
MSEEIKFEMKKNDLENEYIENLFDLVKTPNFKSSEAKIIINTFQTELHYVYSNFYSPTEINFSYFNKRVDFFM